MNSVGTGYANYGLTLAATTMVPLQGFWNSIVYARPRVSPHFSKYVGYLYLAIISHSFPSTLEKEVVLAYLRPVLVPGSGVSDDQPVTGKAVQLK